MLKYLKPAVFTLCLLPLAALLLAAAGPGLGANPIEKVTHETGTWALNLLLLTLAVTPLRRLTGRNDLIRLRRMLGLFAFFYASLHFLCYLVLDHFLDWQAIIEDITRRPYITAGFSAFLLMLPLAMTSTRNMMLRLGKYWRRLHRLVYLIAILGILHFLWLVKADHTEPLLYGLVLSCLLLTRWRGFRRPGTGTTAAEPGNLL